MINIKHEADTRSTTAVTVTVGGYTRYYHVGNSERVNSCNIKLAKNNSLTDINVSAVSLQEFLNTTGRAYKREASDISMLLFGLGYDQFKSEIEALKLAKSRRQVDCIVEDVVYSLCAAYIILELDSKYIAVSEENKLTIPELIKAMSDGASPVLTEKQRTSIKQIAERKQSKDDTSAAWWRILKTLEG